MRVYMAVAVRVAVDHVSYCVVTSHVCAMCVDHVNVWWIAASALVLLSARVVI